MNFKITGKVERVTHAGRVTLYDEVLMAQGDNSADVSAAWYAQMDAAFGQPPQGETLETTCKVEYVP